MGEWISSSMMEAKLRSLMAKGLFPPKEVVGWTTPEGEAAPHL
jgi:hypothetical protein